jgi:hypothetical protein
MTMETNATWRGLSELLLGLFRTGVIETLAVEILALAIFFPSGPGPFSFVTTESHPILRRPLRGIAALALLPVFVQIDEVAHVQQALRRRLAGFAA